MVGTIVPSVQARCGADVIAAGDMCWILFLGVTMGATSFMIWFLLHRLCLGICDGHWVAMLVLSGIPPREVNPCELDVLCM